MFRKNKALIWRLKLPANGGSTGWGSLFMPCVFSLMSAFLFAWSGIHILLDAFPELAAYSGGEIPIRGYLIVMAVVILAFQLPGRRFPLCRKLLLGLLPLAALFFLWRMIVKQGEELFSGGLWASSVVIAAVNRQYKFNFSLPEGQEQYCALAAAFLCGVLLLGVTYVACLCGKRWIVMSFPMLLLALGMTAGSTPGLRGMTECFMGLLFCQAGGWEGIYASGTRGGRASQYRRAFMGHGLSLLLLLLLAIFLPMGIYSVFSEKAVNAAASGGRVVAFQRQMEEALERDLQQLLSGSGNTAKENINNRTPKYTEKEILHVTVEEQPEYTIYLHGFYGGEYAQGGWNSNRGLFLEALSGQRWSEEEVARWLGSGCGNMPEAASLGADEELEGAIEEALSRECTVWFEASTTTVYAPYFLSPETEDEALQYSGEYQISKKKSLDTVQFGPEDGLTDLAGDQELENWYSSYVKESCMAGSDMVPSAQRIADELLDQYSGSYSRVRAERISEELDSSDIEVCNEARLQFARIVSEYLGSGKYSLSLQRVPDGTDVIEYFLTESKTGYCAHYASAGVLILQSMGIPARYASGYVVMPQEFKRAGSQYEASVKDSAAHAWAEIYLEDIGWVPVEMTPGYGDAAANTLDEEMATLRDDPVLGQPEENGQASGESAVSESLEPAEPSMVSEPSEPSEQTDAEGKEGNSDKASGQDSPGTENLPAEAQEDKSVVLMVVLIALGAAVLLLFLLYLICGRRRRKNQLLRREIRQRRNRGAVLRMNRSVYRKVKRKSRQWLAAWSDDTYKQLLIKTYPDTAEKDWEQFISIVQKACFSKAEITDEEVQAVYRLFRRT